MIPRDYPEVSSKVADRTIQGSLTFVEKCARLTIQSVQGWSVESDKELVKYVTVLYCHQNEIFFVFVRSPVMKLIDPR